VREASRPLTLRAHVAAHRRSLTQQLSEGVGPTSTPALALRAEQLVSDRHRRSLARSLRRTVHDVLYPPPRRVAFALVRRGAVIDGRDAIDSLSSGCTARRPSLPRGPRWWSACSATPSEARSTATCRARGGW
jgi:hypothetical protein